MGAEWTLHAHERPAQNRIFWEPADAAAVTVSCDNGATSLMTSERSSPMAEALRVL
jgi:hypothetical protein